VTLMCIRGHNAFLPMSCSLKYLGATYQSRIPLFSDEKKTKAQRSQMVYLEFQREKKVCL
jgi:hypothetical protein